MYIPVGKLRSIKCLAYVPNAHAFEGGEDGFFRNRMNIILYELISTHVYMCMLLVS